MKSSKINRRIRKALVLFVVNEYDKCYTLKPALHFLGENIRKLFTSETGISKTRYRRLDSPPTRIETIRALLLRETRCADRKQESKNNRRLGGENSVFFFVADR